MYLTPPFPFPRRCHGAPSFTLGRTRRCSICLGLFALLCWDALFAHEVSASHASAEPASATSKHSRRQEPPPQGLRDTPSEAVSRGCCGRETSVRSAAAMAAAAAGEKYAGNRDGRDGSPGPSSSVDAARAAGTENRSDRNGRRRRLRDDDGEGEEEGEETFRPFPSPFQSEPADLLTPAFAGRRRRLLGGVYDAVERGGAGALIRGTWSRHYGKACTGERDFRSIEGWPLCAEQTREFRCSPRGFQALPCFHCCCPPWYFDPFCESPRAGVGQCFYCFVSFDSGRVVLGVSRRSAVFDRALRYTLVGTECSRALAL